MHVEETSLKPRQRIFQRERKRLSIRLEEEFWRQLEAGAGEDGRKLTDLIFDLTRGAEGSVSRSSLLRTYCVRWLRQKLVQARLSASEADLQTILSACTTPCVVISLDKKLLAHNRAFSQGVLSALIAPDQMAQANQLVRFALSRPIGQIARAVVASETSYSEAYVAFSRESQVVQMVGRFCFMRREAHETSPLLCFLISHKK